MMNRMETDPDTGVMTIYDDDDSTPLLTGNIYDSEKGVLSINHINAMTSLVLFKIR